MHVAPALLTWAVERSGLSDEQIIDAFPRFPDWLEEGATPTLKELDGFAHRTRTPLGYLFLAAPPDEPVPIHDFRTWGNAAVRRPSANLLETIYACQRRQSWYRDYVKTLGLDSPGFVGSIDAQTPVTEAAAAISSALSLDSPTRSQWRSDDSAWRWLVSAIESLGVLVMINSIVGNDTHRKLDPAEFRGFALADDTAPVIFVNGADSRPSRAPLMFTLVHELAHVWAGDSGLSAADPMVEHGQDSELWANQVAAEVLVPAGELAEVWIGATADGLQGARRVFHVSTLVVLKQALTCGLLGRAEYERSYNLEWKRVGATMTATPSRGGNFYYSQPYRVSRRLARAVVTDTLEGRTLFTEAYSLIGTRKHSTFERLAETVMA